MNAVTRTFGEIRKGDAASFTTLVSESDVLRFAEVSGDYNPLHVDTEYAQHTVYGERVVHGMYLGALVSRLIGMELPGEKALLLKESLEFKKPVVIGNTLLVQGTVAHKSEALSQLELHIEIFVGTEVVAEGTVHVRVLS